MDSGFIHGEQHLDWVANIVPISKKNGKIWICIDLLDLNTACPKDEFSLPITVVMINNMCGYERMSFLNGFSRYNQIKIYPEDEKYMTFRIRDILLYVMPFGLKNASAIYQRVMNVIF